MIEDFFTVNETLISLAPQETHEETFCVEGPGVIDFVLASSDMYNKIYKLVIDNVIVAEAEFEDNEALSNLSLLYRGKITEDSQV